MSLQSNDLPDQGSAGRLSARHGRTTCGGDAPDRRKSSSQWANAGLIPCHRVPGTRKYRFLRDEILGWLKELPSASADDEEEEDRSGLTVLLTVGAARPDAAGRRSGR